MMPSFWICFWHPEESKNILRDSIENDEIIQDAVMRQIQIIGEAARKILSGI